MSESVPEVAKKKLEEEWIKHTAKNKVKIDAAWRKNIERKKEAFQRGKAQKNSQTGRHNTDKSLRKNRKRW